MNIKVSIIIPTYKGSKNILVAVKSALKLTNIHKEIIVVDDNGKKTEEQINTEKILKTYIEKNQITYVTHVKNINGSAARNTGFRISSGKYIIFLDDDDYLFPDKVYKQILQLEENEDQYGFSVTAGFYVHKNGRGYKKSIKYKNNFLYHYLKDENYFNTSTIVVERTFVELLNGFDESFKRHQDWEFCSRLMTVTDPCYINEPLLIKYAENRNVVSNFQVRNEQLEHFFSIIFPVIEGKLSKTEINKIIKYKRNQIFLSYILQRKVKDGLWYLKNNKYNLLDFIGAFLGIFKFVCYRLFWGNKKITYSYEEIKDILEIGDKNNEKCH